MIGHWLLQLTREQEDNVLTTPMGVAGLMLASFTGAAPCVMGAAGMQLYTDRGFPRYSWPARSMGRDEYWHRGGLRVSYRAVWHHYDLACERFGVERVAQAIRNRILSNRAWRTLAKHERALEHAGV